MEERKAVQGEVQFAIMKARETCMDKINVRLKSGDMRSARKTEKKGQAYLQRGVILVRQLWLELKKLFLLRIDLILQSLSHT